MKSGDLTAFEPELLLKEHNARIAKDPEFQNIMKDIARFNAMKDKRNIVSLNYAVREKENNEDDATRLARLNERFKREGKPELKKLDDLPKDYQEPDPYLDETVNIALDLAKLEKARPAEQPAPVSINQAQEIVPDFLTAARCRKSDATKCKVVSSVTYALSRLENSRVTHTMWVSHIAFC